MTQVKKTYHLTKVKQLIDLNQDSTNFDLSFKVTCHDDTPFHVLVVDQTTLDNSEELNYKETKNIISGNILADKNIYQNYFLILKSEKECKVDVELIKKELPRTPDKIDPPKQLQNNERKMQFQAPSESFNWKKIGLLTVVIVGGLALLWYFYKKSNKKAVISDNTEASVLSQEKDPIPKYKFASSPDPRVYRPNMKFNSNINDRNSYKENMNISNRSPDIISNVSENSYKDGGNGLHIKGNRNGGVSQSLLDRLRNAKV